VYGNIKVGTKKKTTHEFWRLFKLNNLFILIYDIQWTIRLYYKRNTHHVYLKTRSNHQVTQNSKETFLIVLDHFIRLSIIYNIFYYYRVIIIIHI